MLLLAIAAHTAEVSGLKQNLERAEKELGLVKKQLEDIKGMQQPVCMFRKDEWFMLTKVP